MIYKKLFFVVLTVLSLSLPLMGQKIDSLLAVLDTAQGDKKVKTLNELFRANLQSDPVKAVEYSREALNLATRINDRKGMAASYNNLGISYRNQGALDKALEYYISSLKIYEEIRNKEGIATTKNNSSTIYAIKKDHGQALRYLEESHKAFVELGDQIKIIGSLNNLGNLHSDIQLYEQAMKYFSQAHQLAKQNGYTYADPLTNVGNLYFRQGNFQRAVESYKQALELERATNNQLGILNILTNIGVTLTKARQAKEALQYLEDARALSKELDSYSSLPSIYKAMAENYYQLNKMKEAYETFLLYDEVREKMYGDESSSNIAHMEMVLNFQEQERQYEMLKKEDEIKTLELRNSRLFIVMVVLAILTLLGGYNFYYLNKKKAATKKSS